MDFLFPDVGEGLHEAKLVKWHTKEGDHVNEDDILAEVETDKAVVDIPSPHTGIISKLHVQEGEQATVGKVFITFDAEKRSEQAPQTSKRSEESGTKRMESTLTPKPPTSQEHQPPAAPTTQQGSTTKRVLAAPSTRRLARELNIDLTTITGTGPAGRITQQDVEQASGQPPKQEPESSTQPEETGWQPPRTSIQKTQVEQQTAEQDAGWQPPKPTTDSATQEATTNPPKQTPPTIQADHYTGIRKATGEHMMRAAQAPTVTLFARADFTELAALREHLKEWAEQQGAKLTFLPLIAKAVCGALKKHPALNAHFANEDIHHYEDVHLGIAVDTEHGLFVPVIKNADKTSVLDTAKKIEELATQVAQKTLAKEDMSGSTFSISNIGPLRVEGFTPILNSPEVGILGVGAINQQPWVVEGELRARKICTLSLTFDHRALDGAEASRFLTTLVTLLEDPEMLILQGV